MVERRRALCGRVKEEGAAPSSGEGAGGAPRGCGTQRRGAGRPGAAAPC